MSQSLYNYWGHNTKPQGIVVSALPTNNAVRAVCILCILYSVYYVPGVVTPPPPAVVETNHTTKEVIVVLHNPHCLGPIELTAIVISQLIRNQPDPDQSAGSGYKSFRRIRINQPDPVRINQPDLNQSAGSGSESISWIQLDPDPNQAARSGSESISQIQIRINQPDPKSNQSAGS